VNDELHVGYPRSRFEYFWKIFAQMLDQVRPTLDQDRARRALSDGLFGFSKRPPLLGKKP